MNTKGRLTGTPDIVAPSLLLGQCAFRGGRGELWELTGV